MEKLHESFQILCFALLQQVQPLKLMYNKNKELSTRISIIVISHFEIAFKFYGQTHHKAKNGRSVNNEASKINQSSLPSDE
jgi:hypothetical protein